MTILHNMIRRAIEAGWLDDLIEHGVTRQMSRRHWLDVIWYHRHLSPEIIQRFAAELMDADLESPPYSMPREQGAVGEYNQSLLRRILRDRYSLAEVELGEVPDARNYICW